MELTLRQTNQLSIELDGFAVGTLQDDTGWLRREIEASLPSIEARCGAVFTVDDVRQELKRRGVKFDGRTLGHYLRKLCERRKPTLRKVGYATYTVASAEVSDLGPLSLPEAIEATLSASDAPLAFPEVVERLLATTGDRYTAKSVYSTLRRLSIDPSSAVVRTKRRYYGFDGRATSADAVT